MAVVGCHKGCKLRTERLRSCKTFAMDTISWNDFAKINLRVGTVLEVRPFPEALKPAYQLWVDFGVELGTLKTSAQITDYYMPESLKGRQVIAVVNFPPKQIGPFLSECLILGALDPNGVVLLSTDQPVANGIRIA